MISTTTVVIVMNGHSRNTVAIVRTSLTAAKRIWLQVQGLLILGFDWEHARSE